MKLLHAGALSLLLLTGCGTEPPVTPPELPQWEIMHPPEIGSRPYTTPDETAPLSKWVATDQHTYPTQNECEQALESSRERARHYDARFPQLAKLSAQMSKLADAERCVSIDDPKLKSN